MAEQGKTALAGPADVTTPTALFDTLIPTQQRTNRSPLRERRDHTLQDNNGGLRTIREAAGLSRERLGRLADCSSSTIHLIERGMRPSDAMAAKIAGALGVDVRDLREGEASR